MVNYFNYINQTRLRLLQLINEQLITDFRITLKVNGEVLIRVLGFNSSTLNIENLLEISDLPDGFEIELITSEELENESFLKNSFADAEKVNLKDSRRRLGHMLNVSEGDNYIPPCPIVTFYSYKGGMGRSTTLAAFATYCAAVNLENGKTNKKSLKTVIIDCDFEAPGFTNYFLEVPYAINQRNGVIEYLTDKTLGLEVDIRKYIWEVSKEFAGAGEIFVMPAGNLNTEQNNDDFLENDLGHYLEGLARLDLSSPQFIIKQFRSLIDDLHKTINPDIILIDSRTGFNDVFGITAFGLSKLVVGFFGNNVQSYPGLHLFLNLVSKMKNGSGIVVNAIVPEANRRGWFSDFQEQVNRMAARLTTGNEMKLDIPTFLVRRNDVLASIGTKSEDKLDFIEMVHKGTFPDYNELFDKIHELAFDILLQAKADQTENINSETQSNITIGKFPNLVLKEKILNNLLSNLPDLYAENIDMAAEFRENRFFFRKCMEDIFNLDKILIIGSKGTGKSYLYQALKNPDIVSELKKRARKEGANFEFMHLIDNKAKKFIDTELFTGEENFGTDKFYHRFWIIYVWNAVMLDAEQRIGYKSKLNEVKPIKNDATTAKRFRDIISNEETFIGIEKDLNELDEYLKSGTNGKNLIVIFDQLDEIVKPIKWSERVAPLINFWKRNPYSRIHPKLFVRRDLFRKIGNVTNSNELENKAIDIEWTQEELFAYFFKLLFSSSRDEFLSLMKAYGETPKEVFRQIEKRSHEQFPLEAGLLDPCVSTFFGKYAGTNNNPRFGKSYQWIYTNLKNADDTISLRPFLDWLKSAIEKAAAADLRNIQPILEQYFYVNGQTREYAAQRYFDDLAREKGNEDLSLVFEFIDRNSAYKFQEFNQADFDSLLNAVINKYGDKVQNKTIDSLTDLLKVNGIIRETHFGRGIVKYTFPMLYKYRLGLKDRPGKY